MESPPPRLDVEVPAPAAGSLPWSTYFTVAAMVALGAWMPWSWGLPVALPALLAWAGLRSTQRRSREGYRVRIDDTHVEELTALCHARTPLVHLQRVVESADRFTLVLANRGLVVPLAALGGDRRRLLDALPANVVVQSEPVADRAQGRRTIVLWLVLVALLTMVYYLAGSR